MSDREEAPATLPPPPGEDDAYSAATKVGALPVEVLDQLRAEGLLSIGTDAPRPAPPRAPPPRPVPPPPAVAAPASAGDDPPRSRDTAPPPAGQSSPPPRFVPLSDSPPAMPPPQGEGAENGQAPGLDAAAQSSGQATAAQAGSVEAKKPSVAIIVGVVLAVLAVAFLMALLSDHR